MEIVLLVPMANETIFKLAKAALDVMFEFVTMLLLEKYVVFRADWYAVVAFSIMFDQDITLLELFHK